MPLLAPVMATTLPSIPDMTCSFQSLRFRRSDLYCSQALDDLCAMLRKIVANIQEFMDPLSEIFSLLDMRSAASARFEAGGAWALRFPAKPYLKFNAVLRGQCWIALPGERPCRLDAGDTFLLANAPPFVLASDPDMAAEDAARLYAGAKSNIVRYGGDDTVLIGGGFIFQTGNAQLLLDALPSFIHIPAKEPAAAILRGTLALLDDELGNGRMGASLMTRRLADILLVQGLRAYVAMHGAARAGWIGALNDRRIGAALNLMHGDVGHDWKVDELACAVGMSRSGFALRFKELVGAPPRDYLLRWRMQLARDALRRDESSVASLAARFGYASESAFGNAFKRVFGRAPKRYWAGN
jgi:AraC-like DNA-binding protein